ncbi:hypothetical protein GOP47_0027352 [Adiantum capillus-veneris]|nr:hypothetical protein GOP47_0027352 [Adiantum capillus-veneris]
MFVLQQGVACPSLLNASRDSSASAVLSSKCHHVSSTLQQQSLYHRKRRPLHNPLRFSKRAGDSRTQTNIPASSQNMDEELDEDELDDLFEKHGEVVISDSTPASAEVDDDSQSLALAVALAEAANDIKAVDILVLHVKPLVYWTRFFVIATAFSRPQLAAIAKKMRDVGDERFKLHPRAESKPTAWTLLDYGDVVVHVFLPKERAFYNLEEFYGNAPVVELSFNASDKATSSD